MAKEVWNDKEESADSRLREDDKRSVRTTEREIKKRLNRI
jgi:hypothetical protein